MCVSVCVSERDISTRNDSIVDKVQTSTVGIALRIHLMLIARLTILQKIAVMCESLISNTQLMNDACIGK